MLLYLAQSFPDAWGGVRYTAESMKLHLAERDPQHHSWAKSGVDRSHMQLRILLSYHYYKDTDLDALFAKYFTPPYPEVFADSGAFSATSQGAVIDINDYAAWVKRWSHLLAVYSNLDVIGDAEQTERNQRTLEDAGLNPLPVFHTGSPLDALDSLIDRYPYIALGGMVPYMRFPKRIIPWLIQCFKRAQGRAVFHGFGATSWVVVKSFPWYSVDSSSWGSGFRYGQVPIFEPSKGKFQTVNLGDAAAWRVHAKIIGEMGFDWRDFADRTRNDRAKICAISALSYMMAEQWLRKRHGEIYIPGRQGAPGVRAHLVTADSTSSNMGAANLSESLRKHGLGETLQGAGERLHLADTSNGINYGDADKGLKVYGCVAGGSTNQIPAANMSIASLSEAIYETLPMSGVKLHQTASVPSQLTEWRSRSATQSGVKVHLTDSPFSPGRDLGHAQSGVKLHLAEHSLDRGGVGDTSRAMEVLSDRDN